MGSSKIDEVMPASTCSYSASLRVRHPTKDLSALTDKLQLEPAFTWKAGDPRRSQSGSLLGGSHHDSYWSALLPSKMMDSARAMPLELFLGQQLFQLARHQEFLSKLQSDGGQVSLLVEITATSNASFTLSSMNARKLAELNIEVEFQLVDE